MVAQSAIEIGLSFSSLRARKGQATIVRVSMDLLRQIWVATWEVVVVASPFILLGLAAAGVLHVAVRSDRVALWLGGSGFGAVVRAALVGVPLPLCSCAVVPVTIELSRKGASREASLAFLVSTPETGVDSILLTYGLMGPVMAIARPIAAVATSLVAAGISLFGSGSARESVEAAAPPPTDPAVPDRLEARSHPIRRALHYGYVEMVDEIGFWLVVGLLLTGVITALVPDDFVRDHVGEGPAALLILLVLGVPLYMCASASTPIAAALLLKGVSPGAALVFLLAGPATNASSLVLIARFFGHRFVRIYLVAVVAVALASGLALDSLVGALDLPIRPVVGTGNDVVLTGVFSLASALVLLALLAGSLVRGGWKSALREVAADIRRWIELLRRAARRPSSRVG